MARQPDKLNVTRYNDQSILKCLLLFDSAVYDPADHCKNYTGRIDLVYPCNIFSSSISRLSFLGCLSVPGTTGGLGYGPMLWLEQREPILLHCQMFPTWKLRKYLHFLEIP